MSVLYKAKLVSYSHKSNNFSKSKHLQQLLQLISLIDWLLLFCEITCEMIDSSYQLSYHAAYQLNLVSGLI